MSKKNFPVAGTVTKNELNTQSLGKLIEIYNKLAEKPVKAFRDKPTALERVWALGKADEAPAAAPKAERKERVKKEKAPSAGRQRRPVDLAYSRTEENNSPRAGTAVDIAMQLWGRPGGATDEEVCEATGKSRGHVRGILRWCNKGFGYGFKQEGDKIFLVDAKGKAATYTPAAKA
jgi:hypothetical protein